MVLTDEQRARVEANLGLVGLHLSRQVAVPAQPRRDIEAEDLFQEGVLGLAKAAVAYDETRHGAFAGFALRRIHSAVSRALWGGFATVRGPAKPPAAGTWATRPQVRQLGDEPFVELRAKDGWIDATTIGERMHELYVETVREVAARWPVGRRGTGDHRALIDRVVEDRLLVAQEEQRRPLRDIARTLHWSTSRVTDCEQTITRNVARQLEADPEYRLLRRCGKRSPAGPNTPIDERLRAGLQRARRRRALHCFRQLDESQQGVVVLGLTRLARRSVHGLVEGLLRRIADADLPEATRLATEHGERQPQKGSRPARRSRERPPRRSQTQDPQRHDPRQEHEPAGETREPQTLVARGSENQSPKRERRAVVRSP